MTFTIIEANMTGLQHSPVNSFVCMMISKVAKEKVNIYCSKEHFEILKIKKDDFIHHSIKVPVSRKGNRVYKFFIELQQAKKIIKESKSDFIVFFSAFPNVQFFLTKFLRKNPQKKVILFTHGEAEGLEMKGKWKFWSYPFWITLCSKLRQPANLYRIVLGESIKQNLQKYFDAKIYSLLEPIEPFERRKIFPTTKNNIFAFIGACSVAKGGKVFVEAAVKNQNSDSRFLIIGKSSIKIDFPVKNLEVLSNGKMLAQNEFDGAISKVTYACFPYRNNTYKFTASGAVLDAVRFAIPVIYIQTNFFDYIFRDAGNIGYACADEEDFIHTIQRIDENCDSRIYEEQVQNLKKLQKNFSLEKIGDEFKKIVENLYSNNRKCFLTEQERSDE